MRTGIVLAGGRSARFGTDKLAEQLGGAALLERAVAALDAVADEVIVAGRTFDATSPGTRSIPDAQPFAGPLAALQGALAEARGTSAVVVGGDMPRLVPNVLRSMLERLDADPAVDAVLLGRPDQGEVSTAGQPPRRAVLPLAVRIAAARIASTNALQTGDRSLQAMVDRLRSAELPPALWLALDPDASTLLDIDTRADLERIGPG